MGWGVSAVGWGPRNTMGSGVSAGGLGPSRRRWARASAPTPVGTPAAGSASISLCSPSCSLAIGLGLIVCGLVLLSRLGGAYRVGRLLAAAPLMPIAAAVELARSGEPRYVRVHGRITSAEEFPDEHDRPLVFRRRRLELRTGGRWQDVWHEREAVPFGVEERAAFIAVDAARLEHGLVVIPRESRGRAGEVPEHLPPGTDPAAVGPLTVSTRSRPSNRRTWPAARSWGRTVRP